MCDQKNDLIVFPGLLTLEPEQESPTDESRLQQCGEAGEQIRDAFTLMDELAMRQNMLGGS